MAADGLIPPYGGVLVNRRLSGPEAEELRRRAEELPCVELDPLEACDLHLVASGACSPLEGFMDGREYRRVVHDMHLGCGLPWTLPVVLRVDGELARRVAREREVALAVGGRRVGVLEVQDVYSVDLREEARRVYGTDDRRHPGVDRLLCRPGWCVGGPVWVWGDVLPGSARAVAGLAVLTPAQTRELFRRRGWKTVAAFQTRNPGHRAHEYLQKCVLEWVDGLLVHPLVGFTKDDDLPAPVRLRAYEILLRHYFPPDRVLLAPFPGAMRYAGPREAVFHAIVRRNHGCSHFVVGRDHAGVGGFYGPFEAHAIFDRFDPAALGIVPLRFDGAFYCRRCGQMATPRTCPHGPASRRELSGTRVRQMLAAGEAPPEEYTRPEVARWLVAAAAEGSDACLAGAATTHRGPAPSLCPD